MAGRTDHDAIAQLRADHRGAWSAGGRDAEHAAYWWGYAEAVADGDPRTVPPPPGVTP